MLAIKEKRVHRIINVLLLNASFIDNIGLMHGKMGIAIFFFHLSRETQNQVYENYAGELIDEIYEEISYATPSDFENGLAGIGWGIEYLAQNNFIEANTDEILEECDQRLMHTLIYKTPEDVSLLNGLIGIGAYFLKRVQNPLAQSDKISTLTNKQMLIYIIDELERRIEGNSNILKEPAQFEITWSYTLLLCFLAELFDLNLFNYKITKMIKQLIYPLHSKVNLPKICSNKLLLFLAIEKLKKCKLEKWIEQEFREVHLTSLSEQLSQQTSRHEFEKEPLVHSFNIENGVNGIALLYHTLYIITGNKSFNDETIYWSRKAMLMQKKGDYTFAGYTIDNELEGFGLLAGIAGIVLSNYY